MATLRLFKRCLAIELCIVTSIGSLLLGTNIAKADYVPPKEQEAPSDYTRSVGAGHRGGCWSKTNPPLTLLAPQTHIGQTTLTHPIFAWFVSEPEKIRAEFRLFKYDDKGKPSQLVKTLIPSRQSSKIQTISLPENKEGLKVGKKYLWQVTVDCPDSSIVLQARADLKVVEKPNSLKLVANSFTPSVDAYARAGFWYDALQRAMVMKNKGVETEMAELLEQLANVEANTFREKGKILSDRLQQILDTEFTPKASYR